jgi:hypothetical protein
MTEEELKQEAEDYAKRTGNLFSKTYGIRYRAYLDGAEPREKRITELEAQIEKMKCCENCGWYYLQQHWRESKKINESRMFHCGTCGNKRNWKLREIKEK